MELLMNIRCLFVIASAALLSGVLGFSLGAANTTPDTPEILGRVEKGLISEHCIPMQIRMDTGAKTSSLSAQDIKLITKDNQEWVQFTLDPEHSATAHQFELPIARLVKIRKRKSETEDSAFENRPVVLMPVTIGSQTQVIQVNLADRSQFNYGMLMGRAAMLQFGVMIDPNLVFTVKPVCESETQVVD
jgi:hypothetical protein